MKVLRLRDIRVCALKESATALLDSGATHALRSATSQEEWETAENVMVQLAGNHQLTMRITQGGTLLMPPGSGSQPDGVPQGLQAQTIVPMGGLACYNRPRVRRSSCRYKVDVLRCVNSRHCRLLPVWEDRKLQNLNNETVTTSDKLAVAAMAMERHWNHYLYDYVATGAFESGLRAVRDAPFFEDLPGELSCRTCTTTRIGIWMGYHEVEWVSQPSSAKKAVVLQAMGGAPVRWTRRTLGNLQVGQGGYFCY